MMRRAASPAAAWLEQRSDQAMPPRKTARTSTGSTTHLPDTKSAFHPRTTERDGASDRQIRVGTGGRKRSLRSSLPAYSPAPRGRRSVETPEDCSLDEIPDIPFRSHSENCQDETRARNCCGEIQDARTQCRS